MTAPADARALAAALRDASAAGTTVRVRGSGTKDGIGDLRPTALGLSSAALTGIVEHVPADLTVTVRAGTRLADLQRALAERGQFVPLDVPHGATATVGGVIASNSNGFGRLRYGGVRHLLIGSLVALADGSLVRAGGRVVKNVAGYDLNKLFVGSFGTLGVIAEATFKVLPLPTRRGACVSRAATAAEAFARADALVHASLRPAALVVDRVDHGWRLVVAAAGEPALVERTLRDAGGEPGGDDVVDALRELPSSVRDGVLIRAALPLGAQRAFAESAAHSDGAARVVADAGSGIVRVHLRGDDATVSASASALMAAAHVVGGSARTERRPASLAERVPAWGDTLPPGHFLMRRIKAAFDPAGILEPGRTPV
ncbi:MAG TPA: FAD-binding oxidoreductase [Candidatus Limnocylindria bacterium]|nr:FAD-binding oxidoreductase [Candidatus Limnocylindria bacterium]